MTDPGDPFLPDRDFGSLVTALQDSLLRGVEHEETSRFTVDPAVRVYDLPREATGVVRITGICGGHAAEFLAGRDYDVGLSRVVWRTALGQQTPGRPAGATAADQPLSPDLGTRFDVTYLFRDIPSGLTDVGPGSVAGTLLRAFGRELALLHRQINEAYRRAFLDTASGAALDGVVALLGVERNPAQAASGTVTFGRRQAGVQLIVAAGVVVEDAAQRRYLTTADAVFGEEDEEAKASVRAVEAGPAGNNDERTLTLMPTPPPGVSSVTNEERIGGGLAAEPDDALRERARHALERAGNATLGALEFAVRDVDGVKDVAVIDHSVDRAMEPGEVRVRFSADGDSDTRGRIQSAVAQVVERTRAAGVQVIAELVQAVTISGQVVVVGTPDGGAAAAERFGRDVETAINDSRIGEPLSLRKLVALVFSQPGLTDVLEAQLTFSRERPRPSLPVTGDVGDLLPVDHSEHAVAGSVAAVLVEALEATAPASVADPVPITVSLLHGGQPVTFRSIRLQVRVEVRARLLTEPSKPPEIVADVVKEMPFDHTDHAVLTLTTGTGADKDLHGYRPGEHDPAATATVTLVGYPVPAATTPLVLG